MRWIALLLGYALLLAASYWVRAEARTRDAARADPPGRSSVRVEVPAFHPTPVRIAYRDLGPRDAPAILLLHGSPGRKENFASVVAPLSETHRVIVPDLPGFGASQRDVDDVSIRAHAAFLSALLDQLGVERVHTVGYSMGGGAALHLAAAEPWRVASLTLLSAIGVQELELLGEYSLNHAIHAAQWAGIALATYAVPHFGALDRFPLNLAYANNFYQSDQRPLRAILETYAGPALILHSESDRLVPAAAAREHHRLLPQSELHWLAGGHFALFRRGDEIARQIGHFVDRVEGGGGTRRADADPHRIARAREPFRPEGPIARGALAVLAFFALVFLASMVSEDLTCIGVGLLVARGQVAFSTGVGASVFALWLGDMLLFGAGRLAARRLRARAGGSWAGLRSQLQRTGSRVLFASRFLPGARLPLYVSAGAFGFPVPRFAMLLLFAGLLWTPLVVGVSAWAGEATLAWIGELRWGGLALALALWLALRTLPQLVTYRGRRLLWGRLKRFGNWEFWPWWLLYQPVLARVAGLVLHHRSLRLVTAANPGIPGGGLVGESKWKILEPLQRHAPEHVARTAFLPAGEALDARRERVERFVDETDIGYPIVVKPDEGDRGFGVTIVRHPDELDRALSTLRREGLVQEFVPGAEFGVFYVRSPEVASGELFSITEKRPLTLLGDGKRNLERLILDDPRAVYLAALHLDFHRVRLGWIPEPGEEIALTELGTHSRGALFLDGAQVETPALRRAVDHVARGLPGFCFGRFDLRAVDRGALQRGTFKVVELNGLTAEATHIYDPRYGVGHALRTLFRQWELAFEVAAANRRAGARPTPYRELVALARHRLRR